MPNWKDPAINETLLAALVAYLVSQNTKVVFGALQPVEHARLIIQTQLNYQTLATLVGGGATYDAVEGRFRKIKKDAAALQAKVDSGELPAAPLRGGLAIKAPATPRKQRTPRTQSASNSQTSKSMHLLILIKAS